MISNLKKNKIFDIIFFEEDFNHLKNRVINSYEKVDRIIVVFCNTIEESEVYNTLNYWIDKIEIINIDRSFFDLDSNVLDLILKKIENFNPFFEDVLCFSFETELPNFDDFDEIISHLNFEPIVLRQTEFVYNLNTVSQNRFLGTCVFTYTMYVQNPQSIIGVWKLRQHLPNLVHHVVDNGFKFNFFHETEKIIQKLNNLNIVITEKEFLQSVEKRIYPTSYNREGKIFLLENRKIFSFDKKFLVESPIKLDHPKKVLVILNISQGLIDCELLLDYDLILNFNFTRNYSFVEISDTGCLQNVNVFLPSKDYYNLKSEYQTITLYSLGELKKNLHQHQIFSNDEIDFIFNTDELKLSEKKSFLWEDLKSQPFEDIFGTEFEKFFTDPN